MAILESFLGKQVEIPEDLRYQIKQGLWAKKSDKSIIFGLTEPALVLIGGVKDIEALVSEGTIVKPGDSVIFAITAKILYLDVPIGGSIQYNKSIAENPSLIVDSPYGDGWLFRIKPDDDLTKSYMTLTSTEEYILSLSKTDGLRNPLGLKGGVSGMCKAVYSSINDQNLTIKF